jgi:uncharacterized protein
MSRHEIYDTRLGTFPIIWGMPGLEEGVMRLPRIFNNVLLIIGMLGSQFMSPAYAASFNCNNASTCTEEVICQTPELSQMDSEMSNLYFKLQDDSSRNGARHLLESQREWLESRDSCSCNANCLVGHYRGRIWLYRDVLDLE